MNYFNVKDLDANSIIGLRQSELMKEYKEEVQIRSVNCYVEKYTNEYNRTAYRLRSRTDNKIIKFWTAPLDMDRAIINKEIREFLEKAKRDYWNTSLFDKWGNFSIMVEGSFGKETEDEIEVIAYFCKCYYVNDESTVVTAEDTNGLYVVG